MWFSLGVSTVKELSMVAECPLITGKNWMLVTISACLMIIISILGTTRSYGQKTCTSNPTTITGNVNFGSITWTASGGATEAECNDMADGLITFSGDVVVDLANNVTVTITNDVNIDGNFPISGGPGSTLAVSGGYTLYVTGDLGDPDNNGVQYSVVTASDEIIVDGTLYGKNNNAFTGDGSISGGTLDVKNGSSCGSPCPVSGGFTGCTSNDGFCDTYTVLPITLLYFDASVDDNNHVVLKWATETEENFDHFEILRSSSNLFFSSIESIPGAGYNTNSVQKYSTVDEYPVIGDNYYRLKAVDIDGAVELFKIEHVRVYGRKSLTIYPNPIRGNELRATINFEPLQGDHIMIFDTMGAELISIPVTGTESEFQLNDSLRPGAYIVKYVSSSFERMTRVIVTD